MELGHALVLQPLPQFVRVGDRDHLSGTVLKALLQGLVAGDRSNQGVALTAKGEEEPDYVLRVAILSLAHVDIDPRCDGFLSE